MSLLISDSEFVEIKVRYAEQGDSLLFFEEGETGAKQTETFWFKRPNWAEWVTMMSSAVYLDAINGQASLNPYKYADIKTKLLLKKWSLKGADEVGLEVNPANIGKLHPGLVQYLNKKLDEKLTPPEELPKTQPAA